MSADLKKKIMYSTCGAIVMWLVNSKFVYDVTNEQIGDTFSDGCPTSNGILIHTLAFSAIIYLVIYLCNRYKHLLFTEEESSQEKNELSRWTILKYSIYSTLIYFFLSSRPLYSLTNDISVKGGLGELLTKNCANEKGIVAHSVIYIVVLVLIMYIPNEEEC